MTMWRLEWLRLWRTRRLVAILAIYVFFGLTGPITARYLGEILQQVGTGGVQIQFPPPRPVDGIAQFISNSSQLALLVVVLVAASALAFDARPEMAIFLRTRVRGVRDIVLPAFAITSAGAATGLAAGTAAAWYETAVLLGGVPASRMLLGFAFGALFLTFAVALTAFVAALVRGVLATAGITLVILLGMAVIGGATKAARYLPTALPTAAPGLLGATGPAHYVPALAITAAATAGLIAGAVALTGRREL